MAVSHKKNAVLSPKFKFRIFLFFIFLSFVYIVGFPISVKAQEPPPQIYDGALGVKEKVQEAVEAGTQMDAAPRDTSPAATKGQEALANVVQQAGKGKYNDDTCLKFWTLKCWLLPVFQSARLLLEAANTLFVAMIDTKIIDSALKDNVALKTAWIFVRDILNLFFILALLFVAFCTIFQVSSYNYQKMLWKIVLMALLVNFSWPIARFIIDAGNIIMYSLLKSHLLNVSGESALPDLAREGYLQNMLTYTDKRYPDATSLFAATIMVLMLGITFLAVGVLLLIRIIALSILLILSPVAFTGLIVPGLTSQAKSWWNNIFNYTFFGPLMIFGIIVSVALMSNMGENFKSSFDSAAASNSASGPEFIASLVMLAVPIVLLWMTMGIAKKMGVAGAEMVTGPAQKAMSWIGMTLTGANFLRGTYQAYKTRRGQASADSWRNRLGTWAGSRQDQLQGVVPGRAGRDAANRYQRDLANKVEQEKKRRGMENMSPGDLEDIANKTGNRFEKAAAIQELANRGQATEAHLKEMGTVFGTTSQVFTQLTSKVKTYNPTAAFSHIANAAERQARIAEFVNSNQFDYKKLGAGAFHDPSNPAMGREFLEIAIREGAVNAKNLVELRKRGDVYNNAITRHIDSIVTSGRYNNSAMESHQNMHMAYFSQTGDIQNASFADHITKNMDEETASRITEHTINTYQPQIEANISQGKISPIAHGIKNTNAAKRFIKNLKGSTRFGSYINGTPNLRNF